MAIDQGEAIHCRNQWLRAARYVAFEPQLSSNFICGLRLPG
jgi:hypothetical protein